MWSNSSSTDLLQTTTTTEGSTTSGNSTDVCINNESWGFIVTALTSTLIISGNLLIIAVIIRFPSRRFRALNWLICQLAVADMSVGLVVLWIGTLSTSLMPTVSLIESLITYGLLASFTSTSTLGVLLIAIDRYFYVIKHSNYKKIVTRRRMKMAIAAAFAVPFAVFVAAPALGWNCIDVCDCSIYNEDAIKPYCIGEHCSQMMTPFTTEYVLVGGLCLIVSLILAIFIYFLIYRRVHSHSSELARKSQKNLKKTELKMVKTMIIVLCGFVFTTGPLAICCLISYSYNYRRLHFIMRGLVVWSTLNSVLNPVFYFWRIPEMSSKLRKMMAQCRCCVSCSMNRSEPLPHRTRRLSSFQVRLHWISSSTLSKKRNSNKQITPNNESSMSTQGRVALSMDNNL